ncbi:MAG: hypothetical protein DRI46_03700 [Chloroflexi bacterium]|nr:MAG: hypothetical protein DRI46_03700 [Chloroflexota bacterium]
MKTLEEQKESIDQKLDELSSTEPWSWAMDEKSRDSMTPQQFAKCGLLRLGVGQDLERIVRGGAPHRIAPAEEILALKPDLTPPRQVFPS